MCGDGRELKFGLFASSPEEGKKGVRSSLSNKIHGAANELVTKSLQFPCRHFDLLTVLSSRYPISHVNNTHVILASLASNFSNGTLAN